MSNPRKCTRCGFKFEQEHGRGRPASNCPTCRQARKDKWRKDQETQKSVGKKVKNEL